MPVPVHARLSASVIGAAAFIAAFHASTPAQSPSPAPAGNCVAIGSPKPTQSFTYRYADKSSAAEYTNRWVQFTPTGSELVTTRVGVGQSTYTSKHKVVDDVFVLEASAASGTDGGGGFTNTATYTLGTIGDPAYRACEGKSWTVPSVNATITSMQGSFSTKTDRGTLVIVKIHESVTVPAGTFDTVHYVKTMGPVVDDFWKSIEHGVTVKRNSRQPLSIATEVLASIR